MVYLEGILLFAVPPLLILKTNMDVSAKSQKQKNVKTKLPQHKQMVRLVLYMHDPAHLMEDDRSVEPSEPGK